MFSYVKVLIKKGADVNKVASNGDTTLDWMIHCASLIFERPNVYLEVQDAV